MRIAKVYIEHPIASLNSPFDYFVTPNTVITKGVRVEVEFNHRIIVGYVEDIIDSPLTIEEYAEVNGFEILPVLRVIDEEPILSQELIDLGKVLARETISPIIACYQSILPPTLKPTSGKKVGIKKLKTIRVLNSNTDGLTTRQAEVLEMLIHLNEPLYKDVKATPSILDKLVELGKIEYYFKEIYRSPIEVKKVAIKKGPVLTSEQKQVLDEIENSADTTYLLEGITGSGKTEIYLQMASKVIKEGQTVLILVPEISLTPAMIGRFSERIDANIAILHSGLSQGEKYDEYRRIVRGEVNVVIGARSAVFAPLKNIGLIVMDEEHSESYKQDTVPCYHALDIVLYRAKVHKAKVILGSATPSLETKARALKGVYHQLHLTERINKQPLPAVEIVDMLKEAEKGNFSLFSKPLEEEIKKCIFNQQQMILLLNRRGYATSISCSKCGYIFKCPNCGVALHHHYSDNKLKCHYCGYEINKPIRCPQCGNTRLRSSGMGTERVEEEIQKHFTGARVIRMDVDSVKVKGGHTKILDSFAKGEYNILLGTQMIAKGLDFPNVTLVGVLNADTGLYCGDFRANERTFQLLTQVVGRSGRGKLPGKAIIQTYNAEAYPIVLAAKQDYASFFGREMGYRRELLYPPYRFLTTITVIGPNKDKVYQYALMLKEYLKETPSDSSLEIFGPAEPYIPKIFNKYRLRIMLKYKDRAAIIQLLHDLERLAVANKITVHFDTSPYQDS